MSFDLKIAEGDLQISSTGDLQQVQDTEKLIQDMLKIVTTPIGGNPHFPWYGSSINSSLVGNPFSFQFIGNIASSQIRESIETLQKWQNVQAGSGQTVTPAELLAAIQEVRVDRDPSDPRKFFVVIKALTKALTPAVTAFDVGL